MRELLYASDAKLAEFWPAAPRWWESLRRRAKFEISTPIASAGIEAGVPEAEYGSAKLDAVIKHIAKNAADLLDDNLSVGQWTKFEAPINYAPISSIRINAPEMGAAQLRSFDGEAGPVLFLSSEVLGQDYVKTRLLLHGSTMHLLGMGSRVKSEELKPRFTFSNEWYLLDWLQSQPIDPTADPAVERPWSQDSDQDTFVKTVVALDQVFKNRIASRMSGYARITAVYSHDGWIEWDGGGHDRVIWRLVAATPLFVERSPSRREM